MIEYQNVQNLILDKTLSSHFHNFGYLLEDESEILGITVTDLMCSGEKINNKNIILGLIRLLKDSNDVYKADVIRNTLEIVLLYTNDDI